MVAKRESSGSGFGPPSNEVSTSSDSEVFETGVGAVTAAEFLAAWMSLREILLANARRMLASELMSDGSLEYTSHFTALESLSDRQWDVLGRLLRGQRVATIAAELFISQSTVRTYLSEIFKKLNVHSQAELLAQLMNLDVSLTDAHDSPAA
jgi:DNA-binding NarL/FixJ family response regulator